VGAPFTYRDLEVWQQGMRLVRQCYRTTSAFPKAEQYGLTAQLRRAAISIPSNVAEGHSRRTTRTYANHVSIALGSHAELETCLEVACQLGFLRPEDRQKLQSTSDSVGRLLSGLHRSLAAKLASARDTHPSNFKP
jgi:four helix bundle protein